MSKCEQGMEARIRQAVREWPQWSLAERRKMPAIEDEIMAHVRDGQGNAFVREWCHRVLESRCEFCGVMVCQGDNTCSVCQ